jgi:phosphatidylserine/phosphatidylglycerophosphate/cardiolipin synthase-like enzyme
MDLLDQTKKNKGHVFAALFELSDEVLISKLTGLGKRTHIVLSNGAHKSRDDDENADSRKTLDQAGCEVHDRMLPSGVLGHNKLMVVCDAQQTPQAAWTGSTNWSPTGLCTQINNGILIHDAGVAQEFFDQWGRLRDAGNATPKDLVAVNSEVKSKKTKSADVDIWFTKTSGAPEMDAVNELVKNAEEGIIFLMFQPGGSSILNAIVDRQANDHDLFVKGVISTMDKNDVDQAKVTLIQRGDQKVAKFRIVQPVGLQGVGKWAAEVSRSAFLNQIGFAIVHSKVIVIDPNGKNPVVVTGSHNFSAAASSKNDENLVIIRGNGALAKAYAVEVQSVFDHYNFRAVAASMKADGKDVSKLMLDPKAWQGAWFRGDKQLELNFWLGK